MKMMRSLLFVLLCLLCRIEAMSPFSINFPIKTELSTDDYLNVQNQLRAIDIMPIIDRLYEEVKDNEDVTWNDFFLRCSKGLRQTLISPGQELFPTKNLEKIGKGGNRCLVCCVPFNSNYPSLVTSISQSLQDSGFNGYFYYLVGGFPNPTGQEIQYAGTPYCFKIFTMMEAYQLGFSSVLWIDSSMIPLRNPDPLFEIIENQGAFLFEEGVSSNNQYIFPSTRFLLEECTGVDVFQTSYIRTLVFGLKMDTELTRSLIKSYYNMVSMGTPFLSCFPEEFVLTAIIGQEAFKNWKGHVYQNTLVKKQDHNDHDPEYILSFVPPDLIGHLSVFFYYRGHL